MQPTTSPLLENYRAHGFAALQNASEEEIIHDYIFVLDIIPLIVERDDEAAFDFVIGILWSGWQKGLIRASLQHNTTKYLEKVIDLIGEMLLEEVDEEENYSVEEACIVVRAYLQTTTLEELWALSNKGPNLTAALRRLSADV